MPYDLRQEPWIPFRRKSGLVEYLAPWQITDQIDTDPIVAIAAPRPDFNGALHEFLIGLFTVAFNVQKIAAWRSLQSIPPASEYLRECLMALPPAFFLDGEGPRFLQDLNAADFAGAKAKPIEGILIDAASQNAQVLNTDLFVKRGRVDKLGMQAAAMALLTLQTYAPEGGAGHNTSVRGGGPLTSLVDPRSDARQRDDADRLPLWLMIAANLVIQEEGELPDKWTSTYGQTIAVRIWPWLTPTTTSNKKLGGKHFYPEDGHKLQAFFGMPRRIRLEFKAAVIECDLTAVPSTGAVTSYYSLTYGVNYGSGLWIHPLSPYYDDNVGKLPVHPQSDGIGWKDWAGIVVKHNGAKGQEPARVVQQYANNIGSEFSVRAFGYNTKSAKILSWADATLPAWPINEEKADVYKAVSNAASQMVEATRLVANLCVGAVLSSLFARREDAKGDFSHIKADVWATMEDCFYRRIEQAVNDSFTDPIGVTQFLILGKTFQAELRATAFDVFDAYVDMNAMDVLDAHRIVLARRDLGTALSGYGKSGNAVFAALLLAPPDKGQKAKKEKAL